MILLIISDYHIFILLSLDIWYPKGYALKASISVCFKTYLTSSNSGYPNKYTLASSILFYTLIFNTSCVASKFNYANLYYSEFNSY